MDNPSDVPHAVEVEGNGVEEETKTLTKGTADVTVDLKAGKYEFYCPVDGHKAGRHGGHADCRLSRPGILPAWPTTRC